MPWVAVPRPSQEVLDQLYAQEVAKSNRPCHDCGVSPGRCIPKAVTLPVAKSVWASACSAIAKVGTYGRECGPESKSAMRTGLSVAGKGRNP